MAPPTPHEGFTPKQRKLTPQADFDISNDGDPL